MDKTRLVDLKRKVFLRSALVPVDGLADIFALSDTFSGDEILAELFKKSLRAFEYHNPLIYESRISMDQLCSCGAPEGYCEIKSNFPAYLKCIISEDQIILVPNSIPQIRFAGSYPYPGSYMLPVDYMRPYINLGSIYGTQFYMRGICNRPIIVDYNQDKTFSDTGAVYWMNIEEGIQGQKFLDQCMVDILEYIRNLKGNMNLPGLNVDIFGAVDVAYQQLKSELDQYYLQSVWRGDLLM